MMPLSEWLNIFYVEYYLAGNNNGLNIHIATWLDPMQDGN